MWGSKIAKKSQFENRDTTSVSAAIPADSTCNQSEPEEGDFSVHTAAQVVMKQHQRPTEMASAVND